jgi:hypothetical protein
VSDAHGRAATAAAEMIDISFSASLAHRDRHPMWSCMVKQRSGHKLPVTWWRSRCFLQMAGDQRVKHLTLSAFMVAATLAATPALAQSELCAGCKAPTPMSDRDRIKADRAKSDLEMKADTRRPWDGLDLGTRKAPPGPAQVRFPD